jgi:hypothetical protein
MEFIIRVYLTITVREKSDNNYYLLLKKIHKKIKKYNELTIYVLKIFSEEKVFEEFYKNNPIREIKRLITNWLI